MRFIIDGKIYDTEKAELIIKFIKGWSIPTIIGEMTLRKSTKLYKTEIGNWFAVAEADYDKYHVEVESEDEVKKILGNCGAIGIYNEHFGQLEEA